MTTSLGVIWFGTASQIEWAEVIKPKVNAEFDRVKATLESVARRQSLDDRSDTNAKIAILEDKRLEVMAKNDAGYFIKHWQELTDQVQKMIRDDPQFATLALAKATRRNPQLKQGDVRPDSSPTQLFKGVSP